MCVYVVSCVTYETGMFKKHWQWGPGGSQFDSSTKSHRQKTFWLLTFVIACCAIFKFSFLFFTLCARLKAVIWCYTSKSHFFYYMDNHPLAQWNRSCSHSHVTPQKSVCVCVCKDLSLISQLFSAILDRDVWSLHQIPGQAQLWPNPKKTMQLISSQHQINNPSNEHPAFQEVPWA